MEEEVEPLTLPFLFGEAKTTLVGGAAIHGGRRLLHNGRIDFPRQRLALGRIHFKAFIVASLRVINSQLH
jgi:hypothetical protein